MANNKSASTAVALPKNGGPVSGGKWRRLRQNCPWLLMLLPAVLVVFLFNYLPIYGVLIAFQDFMPGDQIIGPYTHWVGFNNFIRFFTDVQFWPLMGNTFLPDQAYATAIGLFNSVINVVLLIIANTTSKKFSENSLF